MATTVALAALAVILFAAFRPKESVQYFTAPATKGDIRDVVEATGTINAVINVQVGSQVSGTISALYADFNSHVRAGQVIARIDPSLFEGAVLQARADLQNAQANAAAAKANAVKAEATAGQAQAQYARSQTLAQQGVVSQQQLEVDRATAESDAAEARSMQAQIGQANAQVALKKAALDVAQTNLDHTVIKAPINGTVISRNVDVGQTVAASLQAPTLFQIAQDLTKMQVYTNIDESDVGQIRPGQPVTFSVDAFPKETFHGKVDAIRLNATTVQNVVTYNTIVDFDNPDLKLFPNMTAYVSIPVAIAQAVLRVPNGALRYKPDLKPAEIQRLEQQAGIEPHSGRAQGKAQQGSGTDWQQTPSGSGEAASGGHNSNTTIVWRLAGKQLQPIQIQTGITDHTQTEVVKVLHGSLDENAELVTGSAAKSANAGLSAGPGMGGAPGARGR
jgi:HlyD family secretion protein